MDRSVVARRNALRVALALTAAFGAGSCGSPAEKWTENDGGLTRWIDVPEGRLKTRVYTGTAVRDAPVLVLVLHGDIPDPRPSYHYEFAKVVADAADRARARDVVAAGVLRPGYEDPVGDRSSGDVGRAVADNYTPEVVDAVVRAARDLAAEYDASTVVLVGHSGGAAIVADILGRHPDIADGAVLAGCGCDPDGWRARRRAESSSPLFRGETRSLQPLALSSGVATDTIVRLVVGDKDDVAPPADSEAYANALRARGIDATVEVVPGLGHDILFAPRVLETLTDLLAALSNKSAS